MASKKSTVVVQAILTQHADTDGRITLTDTDIAILSGYRRRCVQYAIRDLKNLGFIKADLYGDHGTRRTLILTS